MSSRSEIILNDNQKELLDTLAFIKSKKENKRITRSALIRESITYWWINKGKQELSDSELILLNNFFIDDIADAKEELKSGEEFTHEEMLKELE